METKEDSKVRYFIIQNAMTKQGAYTTAVYERESLEEMKDAVSEMGYKRGEILNEAPRNKLSTWPNDKILIIKGKVVSSTKPGEWTNAEEAKPNNETLVLVKIKERDDPRLARYSESKDAWYSEDGEENLSRDTSIDYWIPLPELPKIKEEGKK